jgi:hypothetical protein
VPEHKSKSLVRRHCLQRVVPIKAQSGLRVVAGCRYCVWVRGRIRAEYRYASPSNHFSRILGGVVYLLQVLHYSSFLLASSRHPRR